jgi:hypothetical protein
MDQDTPNRNNAGFGTTTGNERSMGGMNNTGMSNPAPCPTCGHSSTNANLEQFLGRLGISDDMLNTLKSQMQNVDVDEYLNHAREYLKSGGDYLKTGGDKASQYAKQNPGKVAAGVAALAVGAGLLISSLNKD